MSLLVRDSKTVDGNVASRNPWAEAFNNLDPDEQKRFNQADNDLLGILKMIRKDTENNKKRCLEKGWAVYRNKNGEEVKLRHVLEKISVWVTAIIDVADVVVSFDKSGQAALPWAVIKYMVTVGTNDITVFSYVSEAVESISGLITRYTVFEKLYLHEDCESTPKLHESLCELYAAILRYLSKAKAYFSGNSLQRFGRGLVEMMRKQYDELWSKITEVDVEKWARLVDVELQRKLSKAASEHYETLKTRLHKLDQPIMQIADQMSVFQDRFNREERIKVFQWMSRVEYRKHHEELSKDLLPHSGQWLLQSRDYIEWGHSSVSSVLWLHGIPGSGKTKLVSTVINNVFEAHSALSAPPIAFFYCARSEAERERTMPVEIMRAILRQLASTKPELPIKEPVAKEYENRKKKADEDCSSLSELTIEDCTRLILALTNDRPATIIIDALDECDDDLRFQLLEALDEIVSKSLEVVKVFVSSRDKVDIQLHLGRSRNVSVSAGQNGQDIQRFIDLELNRLITKKLLLDGKVSSKLRRKIASVLNDGAQGMFRWVALSLEVLRRIKFKKDFEDALGQLPPTLSELYDKIYDQIENTETHGRRVAVMTLKWLLCAQRLLSVRELAAAISMRPEKETQSSSDMGADSSHELDSSSETDSSSESDSVSHFDIVRLCHNLVVFDSEMGVFRFAHQSVREYLQRRPEYEGAVLHELATERCLDVYLAGAPPSSDAATVVDREDLLRPCAKFYWPIHYKIAENHLSLTLKKVLPFFLQESKVSPFYVTWVEDIAAHGDGFLINSLLGLDFRDRLGHRLWSASYSPPTPLAAACAFGLQSLMDEFDVLSSTNWSQQLSSGGNVRTLFHIAAEEGQAQMIRRLLGKSVEPDYKDGEGRTPLSWAASNGHEAVVKLLLEKGVDLESKDKYGQTPLSWAAEKGHKAVVKLLLEKSADLEPKDKNGRTPLSWAAFNGHEAVVKLLLEKGADLESKDENGRTPLLWAAYYGHEAMVRLLLEKGTDLEPKDKNDRTPLLWAVYFGHKAVVKLLLEKGADLESKDEDSRTPLLWAVFNEYEAVVKLLLEKGADLESKDEDGRTPLSWAVYFENKAVVKLLLKKGTYAT